MGSGNRLKFWKLGSKGEWAFGLGIMLSSFPYAVTINVNLLFWGASLGLGKAYDAPKSY